MYARECFRDIDEIEMSETTIDEFIKEEICELSA